MTGFLSHLKRMPDFSELELQPRDNKNLFIKSQGGVSLEDVIAHIRLLDPKREKIATSKLSSLLLVHDLSDSKIVQESIKHLAQNWHATIE